MTERHDNPFACLSPLLRIKKLMENVAEFLKAWHITLSLTYESPMWAFKRTLVYLCARLKHVCVCERGERVQLNLTVTMNASDMTWQYLLIFVIFRNWSVHLNSAFQEITAKCMWITTSRNTDEWGTVFSAVFNSWNRVSTFFAKKLNTLPVPM